jgi:hypothetical protein
MVMIFIVIYILNLGVGWRILLNCIFKTRYGRAWTRFGLLRTEADFKEKVKPYLYTPSVTIWQITR